MLQWFVPWQTGDFVQNLAVMACNIMVPFTPPPHTHTHLEWGGGVSEFQVYCPKAKNQFNIIWEFEPFIIFSFSNMIFYFFVREPP